jgi:cardiolipin synthase
LFKASKLPFKRFMPLRLFPPSLSLNLRTHRKLLIIDRQLAFAGGMNIGDRQLLYGDSPHRASDLHFRIEGPVIDSLVELFEEDWNYSGGEPLEDLPSRMGADGPSECRLISDGPDETLDSLQLGIMGVITSARQRVWIMTPYFLPDRQMVACLQAASLAGVDIRVMIPMKNNWPLVQWALQHNMAELLSTGVNILQRPPPFAHSKCMIVDDDYALIGSNNLDPRSLRLNFELGIEVFNLELNRKLSEHFSDAAASCHPFTLKILNSRATLTRLRDAGAALFAPYL